MASSAPDHSDTVPVSLDRLQRLEACEARADLQERHIELLQKQIADTDAALKLELARSEKHAEARMQIARTCDERTSDMKEQHAAALRVKDAATANMADDNAALKAQLVELAASHAATTSKLEVQRNGTISRLESEIAALKMHAESTLTQLAAAVAAVATGAMEILPVRPSDRRQFVKWRIGGIPPPPPPQFDRAWCAAVSADHWLADVDAAAGNARATVTQAGAYSCTLRSATPIQRSHSPLADAEGQHLSAFQVIVEKFGAREQCYLGFVPSHHTHDNGAATAVAPAPEYRILNLGGWHIRVHASCVGHIAAHSGWTVMAPGDSAYATTAEVPPVPAGGAVEFSVDYAAGSCRVAFYTPVAVAGGFVEAPHAKMELRFVAMAAGKDRYGHTMPARPVPTAADSGVALFPAVEVFEDSGCVWRFAV